jgi:hypothetical protein
MNIECARKKNETSKDRDRKKEKIFTLITKRIKREHTLLCQVKKNKLRKNYFNIFVYINEPKNKKQRSSVVRER